MDNKNCPKPKIPSATPAALPAVLFALFLSLLLASGLALPSQYEETFLGEMKYKLRRLQETPGRRIVLVGGSSVPFAVRSGWIEDFLPDYQAVDFGMYADMGTVAMLDWAASEIHAGDIFILMPEQDAQTLSCYLSGEDVWQAADGAPRLARLLSPRRLERLCAAFPAFAGKKFYRYLNRTPAPEGIYARSSFDAYGDISYPDRNRNIMPEGCQPDRPISFSRDVIQEDFIAEMNDFARAAAARGASVYYRFPPMNRAALTEGTTPAAVDAYWDFLQPQLAFPILGDPHRSIMESGWFYDTNFHLNASGSIVFTKYLIEDLKILFRDTSPTDISLPAMPAAARRSVDGDNSCAEYFLYRQEADGWTITGLSGQGLSAESLVLPTAWEGKPVIGISATVFRGNTAVREITIQPNIGMLHDGMFQGCTNLKKLILTDGTPSSYAVGDNLRQGADFLIYVPEHAIDSYRLHYFWQKYDSYLTF